MTSEKTQDSEGGDRSAWTGPFVARGPASSPPPLESESGVVPPLHLSRDGQVERSAAASVPVPADSQAAPEPTEAELLSGMLPETQPATPPDDTASIQSPEDNHISSPTPVGEAVPDSGSAWDDEPWASTPVSEEGDHDPMSGIIDGDFLLDLPSVALPVEGLERDDPPPPPPAPAVEAGEARGAPDWQQWLRDNQAAGGHDFPPLGDPEPPVEDASREAPLADLGGDLTGLEHLDWDDIPEENEPSVESPHAETTGRGIDDDSGLPLDDGGDFRWLEPSDEPGELPGKKPEEPSFDLDVGPDPEVDDRSFMAARPEVRDSGEGEVEAVAARLERIARSLREHGLTGPFADRDPLGALIAGYLLGATSRGDDEGSR